MTTRHYNKKGSLSRLDSRNRQDIRGLTMVRGPGYESLGMREPGDTTNLRFSRSFMESDDDNRLR